MGPVRDGELLRVSKECLPWAIACRESFFLHMGLQSTPLHWTTYFFHATGDRPPPSYFKVSQLYHICRTSLSSIGDTATCSFSAAALETVTRKAELPSEHFLPQDVTAMAACFPAHRFALDCQHVHLCRALRG